MVLLLAFASISFAALLAAVRFVPFDDAKLRNLDVSTVVYASDNTFLRAYLSRDDRWRIPVEAGKVPPLVAHTTIAAEDKRFYSHHGIDVIAASRALVENIASGRVLSGASTISMQVAGFVLNNRDRTLTRKLKQAFLALQLETRWPKDQILACYLTHASYGGNVCGIEAAARRYFNKTSPELSLGEAALLAGLPQSPERFRPDKHMHAALKRRDYVLRRVQEEGYAAAADCTRAAKVTIRPGLYEVPVSAPHFCDVIKAYYPATKRLVTTLVPAIQHTAELSLRQAIQQHRNAGISNGSILILANGTGEVVAMAGSADYWNRFDKGQVNGAFGFRSPGSALKPFIFAEALDRGLLGPDETLFDVPVTIAGYSPMNFDKRFRGPITAAKALAWSLNIPAIEVLRRVGVPEFTDTLVKNDILLQINPKGDQGLAMAIGTCSVRLLDLTRAYASLADGGALREVTWLKHSKVIPPRKWISPTVAQCVLQILSDDSIRSIEDVNASFNGLKGVAWKTGTSNGFRDAWTFAVTDKYTIGVWLGNMDGKPSRALVGGKTAAPVALSIAQRLSESSGNSRPKPRTVAMEYAEVCSASGLPPSASCPVTVQGRILSGTNLGSQCTLHKAIQMHPAGKYSVCARCSSLSSHHTQNYATLPPEVSSWLRSNAHPLAAQLPPPHNPQCTAARTGEAPVIITPESGRDIILLDDLPASFQKIALSARTADPAEVLFWFVNDTLVGASPAYEPVRVEPQPGSHKVKCIDGEGRSAETWFSITRSGMAEKVVGWSRLSDSN